MSIKSWCEDFLKTLNETEEAVPFANYYKKINMPEKYFQHNLRKHNFSLDKVMFSWAKKIFEEEQTRKFNEKYEKEHPNSIAKGYGPGSMVVYKSI